MDVSPSKQVVETSANKTSPAQARETAAAALLAREGSTAGKATRAAKEAAMAAVANAGSNRKVFLKTSCLPSCTHGNKKKQRKTVTGLSEDPQPEPKLKLEPKA